MGIWGVAETGKLFFYTHDITARCNMDKNNGNDTAVRPCSSLR